MGARRRHSRKSRGAGTPAPSCLNVHNDSQVNQGPRCGDWELPFANVSGQWQGESGQTHHRLRMTRA